MTTEWPVESVETNRFPPGIHLNFVSEAMRFFLSIYLADLCDLAHHGDQIMHQGFLFFGGGGCIKVQKAVAGNFLHEAETRRLDGRADGQQLLHDIAAVAVLRDHFLHPSELPLNSGKAFYDLCFDGIVFNLHHVFLDTRPPVWCAYPAQRKPPELPQEEELLLLPALLPKEVKVESRLWVFWD